MYTKSLPGRVALSLLLTASVLAAVATPGQGAAATAVSAVDGTGELSAVTDSAALSTPVVAQGIVRTEAGTPAASTQVVMYAWPSSETVSAAVEGDTLKLQPVAKATTTSTGAFALKLSSLNQLAASAGADGMLDLEAVAVTDGKDPAVFNFSRQLMSTGGSSTTAVAGGSSKTTAVAAAAGETPYTEPGGNSAYYAGYRLTDPMSEGGISVAPPVADAAIYLGAQNAIDATAEAGEASDEGATETPPACTGKNCGGEFPPGTGTGTSALLSKEAAVSTMEQGSSTAPSAVEKDGCNATLIAKLKPVWSLVGAHFSTTGAVTVGFSYTEGASSTLGVLVKAKGLKTGGTTTDESTLDVTYPNAAGAQNIYRVTKFKYGRYRITCLAGLSAVTWEEYRETDWIGGAQTRYPKSAPKATYCTDYQKGSSTTKKSTNATTWTNGVDLTGADVGLDASIRTGFRTNAATSFSFAQDKKLCGTGDYPGGSPRTLVVKPK